jgi:hypothetical protein
VQDVHCAVTYHGQAHDSLFTVFSSIPFCAYYIDGCSGSSQSIVDILSSIFIDSRLSPPPPPAPPPPPPQEFVALDISAEGDLELDPESSMTKMSETALNLLPNFSIGFTLTNAGGKDPRSLVDREQEVTKCINKMSRKYGYSMTYVGDEPELYGIGFSPLKREGDVQTTWVMLRR